MSDAFNIIMADPPWPYDSPRALVGNGGRGSDGGKAAAIIQADVGQHYDVMTVEQIKALPVASHAAKDALLFLWITNPFLAEGIGADVVRAWGFKPKTVITWAKIKKRVVVPLAVARSHPGWRSDGGQREARGARRAPHCSLVDEETVRDTSLDAGSTRRRARGHGTHLDANRHELVKKQPLVTLAIVELAIGCGSAPLHDVVSNLHYEPDKGCGGGYVMTVCETRADGWILRCWTGDVRDWKQEWSR